MLEYFIFERLKNGAIIEYDDEREVTVDDTMEQRVGEILGVKKLSPNHGPLMFRISVYSMEEGNKMQKTAKGTANENAAKIIAKQEFVNYLHHSIPLTNIIVLNMKDDDGSHFEIIGDDAKNATKLLDFRGGSIAGIPIVLLGKDDETRKTLGTVAHTIVDASFDQIAEWYNKNVVNKK